MNRPNTSWQGAHQSYNELVGEKGHHYHKTIILPKTLELLQLTKESSLLDLGCGQGVLARAIKENISYTGIDLSSGLIKEATRHSASRLHNFLVGDITKPLKLEKGTLFSHAACILAIQNVEHPEKVFKELSQHLKPGAPFVCVMNHPAFRIPRQSSWEFEEATKIQCRKLKSYMSAQKIPIDMHPGKKNEKIETWSFHFPISSYIEWLFEAGFVVERMHEWCSDKVSSGAAAKWENRARKEFPLFLAIKAIKAA